MSQTACQSQPKGLHWQRLVSTEFRATRTVAKQISDAAAVVPAVVSLAVVVVHAVEAVEAYSQQKQ